MPDLGSAKAPVLGLFMQINRIPVQDGRTTQYDYAVNCQLIDLKTKYSVWGRSVSHEQAICSWYLNSLDECRANGNQGGVPGWGRCAFLWRRTDEPSIPPRPIFSPANDIARCHCLPGIRPGRSGHRVPDPDPRRHPGPGSPGAGGNRAATLGGRGGDASGVQTAP